MKRNDALELAKILINGQRAHDYGDAVESMNRISKLWSAYLNIELDSKDAAAMLALLKISRIASGRKADNWVDLIGYAAIGAETEDEEWTTDGD